MGLPTTAQIIGGSIWRTGRSNCGERAERHSRPVKTCVILQKLQQLNALGLLTFAPTAGTLASHGLNQAPMDASHSYFSVFSSYPEFFTSSSQRAGVRFVRSAGRWDR